MSIQKSFIYAPKQSKGWCRAPRSQHPFLLRQHRWWIVTLEMIHKSDDRCWHKFNYLLLMVVGYSQYSKICIMPCLAIDGIGRPHVKKHIHSCSGLIHPWHGRLVALVAHVCVLASQCNLLRIASHNMHERKASILSSNRAMKIVHLHHMPMRLTQSRNETWSHALS